LDLKFDEEEKVFKGNPVKSTTLASFREMFSKIRKYLFDEQIRVLKKKQFGCAIKSLSLINVPLIDILLKCVWSVAIDGQAPYQIVCNMV